MLKPPYALLTVDERSLTDEEIDKYFAQAVAMIREVRGQLAPCFTIPASVRGLVLK